MTREQTIEAIRVMQAYVDGKEVQFRVDDGWKGTFIPLWQWHTEDYRIKPTANTASTAVKRGSRVESWRLRNERSYS